MVKVENRCTLKDLIQKSTKKSVCLGLIYGEDLFVLSGILPKRSFRRKKLHLAASPPCVNKVNDVDSNIR